MRMSVFFRLSRGHYQKFRRIALATMMCGVFFAPLFCETGSLATAGEHQVVQGDTLYSISRHYGIKLEELCAINRISEGTTLKVGQKLALAAATQTAKTDTKPRTYRAERGDTFFSIARKYEVSVSDLLAANNLNDRSVLKAEQVLRIPGNTTAAEDWIATVRGTASTNAATKTNASLTSSVTRSNLWPVASTKVTYVTGKLTGVQFAARENEAVSSVSSGTVIYSGEYRGFGVVVFVKTDPAYVYVYTGLGSLAVNTGDKVTVGTNLGRTGGGDGGRMTFMVYRNGNPIDPATAPRM
jgi:LysM repeat protein